MHLPPDHPLRLELSHEVHARPPEALQAPLRLSFLGLYSDQANRDREWQRVADLAASHGHRVPPGVNHYSADFGTFRLKWERHTEFTRYKFIVPGPCEDPFAHPALESVPQDWLAGLPGEVIVATHAALLPAPPEPMDFEALSARHFGGNVLIGAEVAGGAGVALTDVRLHDGFGRLLVFDRSLTSRQAGRTMQRLLEIDTYRLMALLALPVAQKLTPWIGRAERELAQVTAQLVEASEETEPQLLGRLTELEAEIESRESAHHFRFTAAQAYHELVERRIAELREQRIQGLQTFEEFTERRLAPAMNTCSSVLARLETLRRRVGRVAVPGRHRWLDALRLQLGEYFAGQRRDFDLPLVIRGTPFQEKVWKALLTIPYGETWSYGELAQCVGQPGASRAVGTANGMNRIAIVIPCHRVVNADGKLGGYGGGVWRKQVLLDLERGQRPLGGGAA